MTDDDESAGNHPRVGFRITEQVARSRDVPWVNRQARRIVGVAVCAWLVFLGVTGSYTLLVVFGIVTGVLALIGVVATARAFVLGRHRDSDQLYWRGVVSFEENDFNNRELFPRITRRQRPSIGRQGLTGGRLELRKDGVHWNVGARIIGRGQISGDFFVPWSVIDAVDISVIPHKVRLLGGAITFAFQPDREKLYGEFVGSKDMLLDAFRRSPLGEQSSDGRGTAPTAPAVGSLADDDKTFWNGTQWVATVSIDGRSRWNGSQWVSIAGDEGPAKA